MAKENKDGKLARLASVIRMMLEPLYSRIEDIDSKISKGRNLPKYYRNEDLKKIFGLSSNTIIKYRQAGILPHTKLGDIFLYDATRIEKILHENGIG